MSAFSVRVAVSEVKLFGGLHMKKLLLAFGLMLSIGLAACSGADETSKTPELSDTSITTASGVIEDYMMMEKASVSIEKDTINLSILVMDDSIDLDYAQETGEDFARELATEYATEHELKGPTKEDLGELWEKYNLNITIGTDAENTLWEGTKATDSPTIKWK